MVHDLMIFAAGAVVGWLFPSPVATVVGWIKLGWSVLKARIGP